MPEEPVCKLAPLIDRFQKIGELVTSIGGVDFPHDTAGTAVGQDAVYLPVYLLQIFQCLYIFTGIWHFFRPPGASFDPEHSPHSAQQPILLFEVVVPRRDPRTEKMGRKQRRKAYLRVMEFFGKSV